MNTQIKHYEDKLSFEMDPADLHENLKKDNHSLVIVDARSKEGYEMEHIPGAISFPYRTMNEESTSNLDKSKTYVTYCDGIGCNASTKGALKLARLGFDVRELIGGLEWWKKDGYQTEGEGLETKTTKTIGCHC
ncbi:MAG: rhodanese-like domain-containing protein [Bacteroidetes bacterium]|jgi:rhodanese-related sulfurtransferase|nr:rhodanese-like domain-containing protein [Bacteroidota bacterium]